MNTSIKTKEKAGPGRRILTNLGWLALGLVFLGGAIAALKTGEVLIHPDHGSSYTATRTSNPITFWVQVAGGLVLGGLIVVAKLHTIVTEVWSLVRGSPSERMTQPRPSAADLERLHDLKRLVNQVPGEKRTEQEHTDKQLVANLRSPDEIPAFDEVIGTKSSWSSAYHFPAFGSYQEHARIDFGIMGGGGLSIGTTTFEIRGASPFGNDWTLEQNGDACAHGQIKYYGMMDQMRDALAALDEESISREQEEESVTLASSGKGDYCVVDSEGMRLSLVPSPFGTATEEQRFCMLANGSIVGTIHRQSGKVGLLGGQKDHVAIGCSASVPEHLQLFLAWLTINPRKLSPGLASLMAGLGDKQPPQRPQR